MSTQKYMTKESAYGTDRQGKKRKHDTQTVTSDNTGHPYCEDKNNNSDNNSKRVIQDGFSWWTCLTQGMPQSMTKPHPVNKQDSGMEFPPQPEKPLDSDCCGQGCTPCVFDIYDEEIDIWKRECDWIQNGRTKVDVTDSCGIQGNDPVLDSAEYHTFTIDKITMETKDTYRYRFSLPRGQTLGLHIGQHIIVRGIVNGEMVTRQYTPISDVSTTSYFELMIKIYDSGRMSQYIKDWTVDSEIEIRGPCGCVDYKPNKYRRLVMVSIGTGIAPMAQVIQYILNNDRDDTYIELLYGCRTYQDILLKTELDEWARYWNFSVTYYLSQDTGESKHKYGDIVIKHRIDTNAMKTVLSNIAGVFVLICGTRSFEKDIIDILESLKVPQGTYHIF